MLKTHLKLNEIATHETDTLTKSNENAMAALFSEIMLQLISGFGHMRQRYSIETSQDHPKKSGIFHVDML